MKSLLIAALLATAAFAAAPAPTTLPPATPLTEARRGLFNYDRAAGFALEERKTETRDHAIVRDVSFLSVPGAKPQRTDAFLVSPRTGAPRAAILWVHWLGNPATTNRTQFLEEAVALAGRGAVSVLVDGMWAKAGWYRDRILDEDYEHSVAQVIALRRALDLLGQQPGAERVPLAIVGHDYGGMYATIAAGLEPRTKTCVFIACTPSLNDWAFFRQQPASMDAYLKANEPLALTDFVAVISGATVLFQFAELDRFVPLPKAQEFFSAARAPKQMMVYGGASHEMIAPETIRTDRTAWLVRELGLQ